MPRYKAQPPVWVSNFHLRPDMVVERIYNANADHHRVPSNAWARFEQPNNDTKGEMSKNAVRKLKSALLWLVASAEWKRFYHKSHQKYYWFQLTFVTLTIPDQGEKTDQQIKAMMNSFLMSAKHVFGLRAYCWRAEPQKRGAIHIHLTADCFMHWKELRHLWNRHLKKHSLLGGHTNPNSTDIHSLKSIRNIVAYLVDYYTKKSEGRREIKGRLWGCSHNLTQARKTSLECFPDKAEEVSKAVAEVVECWEQKDFGNIAYAPWEWWKNIKHPTIKSIMEQTFRTIRYQKTTQEIDIM